MKDAKMLKSNHAQRRTRTSTKPTRASYHKPGCNPFALTRLPRQLQDFRLKVRIANRLAELVALRG